ncbi:DUF433 domain-containing protein [Acaryochloris sp. CCMEE 5410]|uniref:DUF433 domain-containing protein n=1 Tax=Acaryochloris sp. CCMEE 5410 TaxID=310037 RepID=UPI0002EB33E8|nr:DUF433 domain-containing protein [Acaryochloris sp. CCMEE 5410]
MYYQHIITIEPGQRSGKPCIRGMRITVYDILEYLAGGMAEAEILEDFSELTLEDIKACLRGCLKSPVFYEKHVFQALSVNERSRVLDY